MIASGSFEGIDLLIFLLLLQTGGRERTMLEINFEVRRIFGKDNLRKRLLMLLSTSNFWFDINVKTYLLFILVDTFKSIDFTNTLWSNCYKWLSRIFFTITLFFLYILHKFSIYFKFFLQVISLEYSHTWYFQKLSFYFGLGSNTFNPKLSLYLGWLHK